MNQVITFKETDDEWCGNYHLYENNLNLVKVTFHGNIISTLSDSTPIFRVSVWGNDDIGMDADFYEESTAWNKFIEVLALNKVNHDDLEKLGFTYF